MKNNRFSALIGLIAAVATLLAASVTFMVLFEKKKRDEEELERYLDCSIQ